MKNLILTALLCASLSAQAGGFTDSDGSLTEEVNQQVTLNLSPVDIFVGCQVADLATTKFAFGRGAVEGNQLMAHIFTKFGWAGLIGVKIALVYGVYQLAKHYGKSADTLINVGSAVTCGVAGHNLMVN